MKVLTGISFNFSTGEEEGRLYEDVPVEKLKKILSELKRLEASKSRSEE